MPVFFEGYSEGYDLFFIGPVKNPRKKPSPGRKTKKHENPIFQVREGYTEGYEKAGNKKGATLFNVTP